jgi:hypothetical protein
MGDKVTGRVAYAVMSFGGFLGMGESYHPLPWRLLTYDPRQGGFVIDLDRSKLEKARTFTATATPNWSNRVYGNWIDECYDMMPYWGVIRSSNRNEGVPARAKRGRPRAGTLSRLRLCPSPR